MRPGSHFLLLPFLLIVTWLPPAAQASAEQAREFINGLGDQALAVVRNEELETDDKWKELEGLFLEGVDVEWIGRFVLGKYWRRASDEQKERYQALYKEFLIKTYVSRFRDYTGETFKITEVHPKDTDEYLVQTELVRPQDSTVRIDYRVKKEEGRGYAIIDIIVEGVSLLTTQRSEFGSVISRRSLDHLIRLLEKKVQKS